MPVQYVDYTLWQRAQFGDLDDSHSPIAAQLAYWEDALAGHARAPGAAHRSALSAGGRSARRQGGGGLAGRVAAAGARGGRASTTRPVSWWFRPRWRCCCPGSAPVLMWRWGSRSPGAMIPRLMSWWVSSSTPWCCGSIWPVIPALPSCWPRCARRSLAAFEHQDVPFEVLVERLNPDPIADSSPAGSGDVGLAEPSRTRHQRSRRRAGVG